MVLVLLVLYDPLILFSYLIYYIYYVVGYDAGGYIIVGGVAGVIYYMLFGYSFGWNFIICCWC